MMKILVTGVAGFIGYHLTKRLIELGYSVFGVDNLNDYYDIQLKVDRLTDLGFNFNIDDISNDKVYTRNKLSFVKSDLCDKNALEAIFAANQFDKVINLAAQAGVRYSLENPSVYIQSNIVGFFNLLECVRGSKNDCELIYASSSSVYGNNSVPFSTNDKTDNPVSLYAATKKANEALANSYAALYKIKCTGLRFFTVYGPWGRPDMAYFSFTKKILNDETIDVFNHGNLLRDFTFINDIVNGIIAIINKEKLLSAEEYYHKIYNIGNNNPVKLLDFINILGKYLNKKVSLNMKPMQNGDVLATYADITEIQADYNFTPSYSIDEGLKIFVEWYKTYYITDSKEVLN